MCFSFNNAEGTKNYIEEMLRPRMMDSLSAAAWRLNYAKSILRGAQKYYNWLLDHEIVDRKLVLKATTTGKPGLAVVNKALEEVRKTKPSPARKSRVRAKRTESVA